MKGVVLTKKKLWNKDFILLLQGNLVSSMGDLMYSVAIGFWVYSKTGSSALMGIMSSISMFVTMFLSPFTGNIVDKCNRKWILVGVDIIQGLMMLTIGMLAFADRLSVAGVLIVALVAAFGSVFYSPSASTLMIDIIPRDDMVRGQSIFSSTNSFISMVGTAFSGVVVAFFGVPTIVVINGLSNLYSAVTELFIHVPKTVQQGQPVTVKGVLQDSASAVKTIFSERFLRLFIPSALILNFLGGGVFAMAQPFILQRGFPVEYYGYMLSVYTVAQLICVVLLGIVKLSPKARFWVMALGFSLSEPLMVIGYSSTNFAMLCVFIFLGAFCNCAGNTIFNASLMLALPEENRGAILGFIQSACTGGIALSTVVYGFLGDVFPLYLVFMAGGLISLIPMLYLCFNPKTREFMLNH